MYKYLPNIIDNIKKKDLNVIWQCDPMHGNTFKTLDGIKTRDFDTILEEIRNTFEVHHKCNSFLGGIHLEMTGEDVTECIGGPENLEENDLKEYVYNLICDKVILKYDKSALGIDDVEITDEPLNE